MAISPVSYRPAYVAPRAAAAPRPAQPTGGTGYQAQYNYGASSGPSTAQMVAWGAGAIGFKSLWANFFRNPKGGALLAVLGVGAFLGNWGYKKLTGRA